MAAFKFPSALFMCILLSVGCSVTWADDDDKMREVTIGSAIKLQHDRLKLKLHSHDVKYGSGSGQQSVTGFQGGDDANDYWIVKCQKDAKCKQGEKVQNHALIRLQHMKTRTWLHSHMHASPISNNFEVSGFGSDQQSDDSDVWKVEIEGKGNVWHRDQKVRLRHVATQALLHSHDKKYGRPIAGQHEVCAVQYKNADNVWVATEGVYFPALTS